MKLLSVLTVCAALCIAVTQASPQLQDEETDQLASEKKLSKLLFDRDDEEDAISNMLITRHKVRTQQCTCHCPKVPCRCNRKTTSRRISKPSQEDIDDAVDDIDDAFSW